MVPAHDEEALIDETLTSFEQLDYDTKLFDVHVVADNCSDATADIVRQHGWTVHERFDDEAPGKGPALNWLFERVDRIADFDVAVIVDADSSLDTDFLRMMDRAFSRGATVAQGFYSVRNRDESAVAGLRFAALACRHNLRPLGRRAIGGSAGLFGNGMAFERPILRRRKWTGHLVEDAELQMELLVLDGVLVEYVPEAKLEAEMPVTLTAAASQNARWERGRAQLARRYIPILARQLVARRQSRRIAYADAIADHLVPPLSILVTLQASNIATGIVGAALGHRRQGLRLAADVLASLCLVAHIAAGLRSVSAPRSVYRSLVSAPKMVTWKMGVWGRAIRPRSHVEWQRTRRNAES
jgi:cellulose synthase/poly-beta-1,6-N-acetylglucosamine synthase-like glycosyltransferase